MINATQTIGQIARSEPATISIFESLGIPYCCRGQETIDEAASSAGVSSQHLLEILARASESCGGGARVDPILDTIIKHLLRSRKKVIWGGLPRIRTLAQAVAQSDDRTQPNATELSILTETLVHEVEDHIAAESGILFPMIQNVEIAYVGINVKPVPPKKLRHAVSRMVHEHEEIGNLLSSIYRLADGYQGTPSSDSPYRALCDELKSLDRELREQVHLENNVLFNRALQFSSALWPCPAVAR
jgi:regulator of cell morphogenesis and NO signaling